MPELNQPAPDFVLLDENSKEHRLSAYRGKRVVLYFYPKDDTPGCTTEACEFRDDSQMYSNAGIVVLGVSADSPESHKKFKEKYHLNFTLLSDENHEVCEEYGVWVLKKMYGKEYYGIQRSTFLIDEKGMIKHIFPKVTPKGHSAEVIAAFEAE
ncbi:MAG: thioredoxin-dependent thiol peroxidase [Anaerolineaceae bacterium]|nr:thioredoxin-dependent thiol peroxidase [Anaerolineaceae bacterium]